MLRKSLLLQHLDTVARLVAPPPPDPVRQAPKGYDDPLDDPGIDPDPDFRQLLRLVNIVPGVRTVSSCQGHAPGERFADVTEPMTPYVTVVGNPLVPRSYGALMSGAPYLRTVGGTDAKKVVSFRQDVVWKEVRGWLFRELLRTKEGRKAVAAALAPPRTR